MGRNQRYDGMDEDGTYEVRALAVNGEDVEIRWQCGFLLIVGIDTGKIIADIEPESFADAERQIEWHCQVTFDHDTVRWQPPQRERVPRPIERRR